MQKGRLTSIFCLLSVLASCSNGAISSVPPSSESSEEARTDENVLPFENADFEYGTTANWTAEGSAFGDLCVQTANSTDRAIRHIEGDFYLDGYAASGDGAAGTLTSPSFELSGNGILSFRLGGGKNKESCYVEILDEEGNSLIRKSNDLYYADYPLNRLYRQEIDLSAHIGKRVVLRIVDADSGTDGWNHLLFDDPRMNSTLPLDDGLPISDANSYQETMIPTVGDTYRHKYHLMPSYGWMNDPNGFVYDGEYYHLFYQSNPYAAVWGNMSWGHARSKDLLNWENVGIAITPDKPYDMNGCFSGGAVMDGSTMRLLYTSVGDGGIQTQSLATSYDGVNFSKSSLNPVIGSGLRMDSRITDFRDPYLFERDGTYYALVGGKLEGPGGQLLLYRSNDLLNWRSVGRVYSSTLTGSGMFECPNLGRIGGKDVIFTSPQSVTSSELDVYQNIHSVTYMVGDLNLSDATFENDHGEDAMFELDKGFDFYATQLVEAEGKTILVAWMNHWSRSLPTSAYGWCGEVTLPRELSLVDGKIYQKPISSIYENLGEGEQTGNVVASTERVELPFDGDCYRLEATIDVSNLGESGKAGFSLLEGSDEHTDVYYDASLGMLVFDRRESGIRIVEEGGTGVSGVRYASVEPVEGKISLEFFVDVSSVEVFVNGGEFTMSGLVYPENPDSKGVSFFSEGGRATLVESTFNPISGVSGT